MFYNEKPCDGCSEIMHDGDDIVVCPDCGTPQHRECYDKNKKCVNEHLHAEGFDWQKAHAEPAEEPHTQDAEAEDNRHIKIEILSSDEQAEMAGGSPDFNIPGLRIEPILMDGNGLNPNDEIDGVKVAEALTYTQVSASRYLKKFAKHKGKKHVFSWNWGAFFFSPAWFFYRKLYKLGAIFLSLSVATVLATTPFYTTFQENYDGYIEASKSYLSATSDFAENESEEAQAELTEAESNLTAKTKAILPSAIIIFVSRFLLLNVIAALIADGAYRKKMLEDIAIAKQATSDPKILKYSLIRRGGVSVFTGLAVLLAEDWLPSLIMNIVTNII